MALTSRQKKGPVKVKFVRNVVLGPGKYAGPNYKIQEAEVDRAFAAQLITQGRAVEVEEKKEKEKEKEK